MTRHVSHEGVTWTNNSSRGRTAEEQIRFLERRLITETRRRKDAESRYEEAVRQISRFHALLIAERIRHINRKESC